MYFFLIVYDLNIPVKIVLMDIHKKKKLHQSKTNILSMFYSIFSSILIISFLTIDLEYSAECRYSPFNRDNWLIFVRQVKVCLKFYRRTLNISNILYRIVMVGVHKQIRLIFTSIGIIYVLKISKILGWLERDDFNITDEYYRKRQRFLCDRLKSGELFDCGFYTQFNY